VEPQSGTASASHLRRNIIVLFDQLSRNNSYPVIQLTSYFVYAGGLYLIELGECLSVAS